MSEKRAAAARVNGRKGGRPRSRADAADFEELGDPPTSGSLAIFGWVQRAVAIDAWRIGRDNRERGGRSKGDNDLTDELSRTASALKPLCEPVLLAESLDETLFDGIKPEDKPPKEPLKAVAWYMLVLVEYLQQVIAGKPDEDHGAALRRNVRSWAAAIPPEVRVEAMRLLQDDTAPRGGTGPAAAKAQAGFRPVSRTTR